MRSEQIPEQKKSRHCTDRMIPDGRSALSFCPGSQPVDHKESSAKKEDTSLGNVFPFCLYSFQSVFRTDLRFAKNSADERII